MVFCFRTRQLSITFRLRNLACSSQELLQTSSRGKHAGLRHFEALSRHLCMERVLNGGPRKLEVRDIVKAATRGES